MLSVLWIDPSIPRLQLVHIFSATRTGLCRRRGKFCWGVRRSSAAVRLNEIRTTCGARVKHTYGQICSGYQSSFFFRGQENTSIGNVHCRNYHQTVFTRRSGGETSWRDEFDGSHEWSMRSAQEALINSLVPTRAVSPNHPKCILDSNLPTIHGCLCICLPCPVNPPNAETPCL